MFDGYTMPGFPAEVLSRNSQNGKLAVMIDEGLQKNTFSEEYATAQAGVAIITPPAGQRVCVRDIYVATNATNGEVQLDFAASSKKVFRLYAAAQNRAVATFGHLMGNVNEPLRITTTTGTNKVFVVVNYITHD